MAGKILINGVDIYTTLNFGTRNARRWWDGLSLAIPSTSPYKALGSLRGSGYSVPPKPWPLALFLEEGTFANRQTQLDALRRVLAQTPLYGSEHRLSNTDELSVQVVGADRLVYAVYLSDEGSPPGGLDWLTGHTDFMLNLMLYDPAKYSTPVTEALSTTPVEIALGTLASDYEVEIYGPVVDPEFIVYEDNSGSAGAELWRIPLVGTVGSGESLIIDSLLHRVLEDNGATKTDITETAVPLDSGVEFKRMESGEDTSVWVDLSTGTGLLSWRKRWR